MNKPALGDSADRVYSMAYRELNHTNSRNWLKENRAALEPILK